jgi:hypothetical protein
VTDFEEMLEEIESENRQRAYERSKQAHFLDCICQLTRERCEFDDKCFQPPRLSHDEGFVDKWTGERIFTIQPYLDRPHTPEALAAIASEACEFAAAHGLTARVSAEDSWHYPDWTILIEYRKASTV